MSWGEIGKKLIVKPTSPSIYSSFLALFPSKKGEKYINRTQQKNRTF
jgi:hypothetical protein